MERAAQDGARMAKEWQSMAEKLILYRSRGACELQPDFERRVVWVSFAGALDGNGEQPRKGERRYDWEDKITLALSVEEATDLGLAARLAGWGRLAERFTLYHDPAKSQRAEGEPKTLTLRAGGDGSRAAAFLEARQGDRRITIALGKGDLFRLETLLPQAVATILGWR
jgi:hypothetical protein